MFKGGGGGIRLDGLRLSLLTDTVTLIVGTLTLLGSLLNTHGRDLQCWSWRRRCRLCSKRAGSLLIDIHNDIARGPSVATVYHGHCAAVCFSVWCCGCDAAGLSSQWVDAARVLSVAMIGWWWTDVFVWVIVCGCVGVTECWCHHAHFYYMDHHPPPTEHSSSRPLCRRLIKISI